MTILSRVTIHADLVLSGVRQVSIQLISLSIYGWVGSSGLMCLVAFHLVVSCVVGLFFVSHQM